jgi:hypothetical protein
MGFFGNVLGATLKTVITPAVIVTDIVKGDFDNTSRVIDSTIDSVGDAFEDLLDGDL